MSHEPLPGITVRWGSSLWLVLADAHLELAGTADVPPVPLTAGDLEQLRLVQIGGAQHRGSDMTPSDPLSDALVDALRRREFTPPTDQPLAALETVPAVGPAAEPDARVSWRTRSTFWLRAGQLLTWSPAVGGLVALDADQRAALTLLTPDVSVEEIAVHVPNAAAALGALAAHGVLQLTVPPRPETPPPPPVAPPTEGPTRVPSPPPGGVVAVWSRRARTLVRRARRRWNRSRPVR